MTSQAFFATLRTPLSLALLVLLAAAPARAQEPTDPTKLEAEELKGRVVGNLKALDEQADRIEKASAALEAEWQKKAKALAVVHGELPAAPPKLLEQPPLDLAKAQALDAQHRQYLEAYRARKAAREAALDSLTAEVGLREALRPELERITAQLAALGPLLDELEARIKAGRIDPKSVVSEGKEVDLAKARERMTAVKGRAETVAKTLAGAPALDKEKEALEGLQLHDPLVEQQLAIAANAAGQILVAVKQEDAALAELNTRAAASLPGIFKRLNFGWTYERQLFEGGIQEVAKQREALEAVRQEREKLARPQPQEEPPGEEENALASLGRELAYSEAMIRFHGDERALLDKEAAAQRELLAGLEQLSSSYPGVVEQLLRLRACIRKIEERKASGDLPKDTVTADAAELWKVLLERTVDAAGWRVETKSIEAALGDRSKVAALEDLLQKEQTRREELKARLEEEKSYAEIVTKVAAQKSEELLAALAPDGAIAKLEAEISAELKAKRTELELLDALTVKARRAIASLENPQTLKASQHLYRNSDDKGEKNWGKELDKQLANLAEGAVLPDRSGRLLEEEPPALNQGGQAQGEEGNLHDAAKRDLKRLKKEDIAANQIRQYFEELAALTQAYGKALDAQAEKAREVAEVLSRNVAAKKRRYACATEVDSRLLSGQLPWNSVPRYVRRQADRRESQSAGKLRDDFLRESKQLAERRQRDLDRLKEVVSWRVWAQIRASNSSEKMALIGTPVAYLKSATMEVKQLGEVEQKNLQYEAATREPSPGASELSLDFLVPFLSQTDRELFEGPLDAMGLELADTRRRIKELSSALQGYEQMISVANAEQAALEKGPAALREAQQRREADYQVARYLCSIAKHPGAQTALELAFKKEFKTELPLPDDTREWKLDFWKENLLAAEARLLGHHWWIRNLEEFVSRRGIEAEVGGYRSKIGQIRSSIEVEKATQSRLLGKIEALEIDFGAKARSHILWAFLELAFVIMGALFMQGFVKRLTKRINTRFEAQNDEDQSDRQKRMQTVTRAISNTFKIVIWVITFIYGLSLLGVNITPLLASASVLGLAIAFGAQAMVKDFFSGLFILLENQYTIGDVVDVGGIAGTVERLSLRVTVLRDIEGIVHYIPNGTVSRVSNKTQLWSRCVMEVGVGYGEDVDRVRDVLNEVFVQMKSESPWSRRLLETPQVAGVSGLMDSSVNIRIMAKTRPGKQWEVGREFNRRIKKRFDELGIEIPFPQRTVHHVYEKEREAAPTPEPKRTPKVPKTPEPPQKDEDEIIPE